MNREEFLINYWRYYNILEEDFIKLTRCVRICETNYKTCSDEIIKQFLSVTSEFENICKEVCEFKDSDEHKNINDIFNKIENIQSVEIIVKHTNDLRIKPFKEWNKSKPWELFWWKGYNEVKHNRLEKYESGNLRNLLNSLAALYFMELYLVREIGIKTEDIDVPNSISRLFEVVDFKTKDTVIGYEQYSMTDGDVAEIIDGLKL